MDMWENAEPKLLTVYAVDDQGKIKLQSSSPSLMMAPMMVTKGSFNFGDGQLRHREQS